MTRQCSEALLQTTEPLDVVTGASTEPPDCVDVATDTPDTFEHITCPPELGSARPNDDEGNLPLQLPDQLPGDGQQELPGDTHQATDGQSCYDSSLTG